MSDPLMPPNLTGGTASDTFKSLLGYMSNRTAAADSQATGLFNGSNPQAAPYMTAIHNADQGLSPQAMASLRTQATSGITDQFNSAAQAMNTQLLRRGAVGQAQLPGSGGDISRAYQPLYSAMEAQKTKANTDMILANEEQKQKNLALGIQGANSLYGNATSLFNAGTGALGQAGGVSNALANIEPASFRNLLLTSLLSGALGGGGGAGSKSAGGLLGGLLSGGGTNGTGKFGVVGDAIGKLLGNDGNTPPTPGTVDAGNNTITDPAASGVDGNGFGDILSGLIPGIAAGALPGLLGGDSSLPAGNATVGDVIPRPEDTPAQTQTPSVTTPGTSAMPDPQLWETTPIASIIADILAGNTPSAAAPAAAIPATAAPEALPTGYATVGDVIPQPEAPPAITESPAAPTTPEVPTAAPEPAQTPTQAPAEPVTATAPASSVLPEIAAPAAAIGGTAGLAALLAGTAPEIGSGVGAGAAIGSADLAAALGAGAAEGSAIIAPVAGEGLGATSAAGVGALGAAGLLAAPALAAAIAIYKTNAHWTASKLVNEVQQPFGQNLGRVVDSFDSALASGQLDKASAQALRDQTAQAIQGFEDALTKFQEDRAKGMDPRIAPYTNEAKVVKQARETMARDFGPNYEAILGKMDREIAALPDNAAPAAPQTPEASPYVPPPSDPNAFDPSLLASPQEPQWTPEQLADPNAMSLEDRLRLWMGGGQ